MGIDDADDTKKKDFLDALAQTANVSKSCEMVNLKRRRVYRWRDADEQFAKLWADAEELGVRAMEDECVRRGVDGTPKPVFHKGEVCGHIQEYSDVLLIFMLKSKRPHIYRDHTSIEMSGKGGKPIEHEHKHKHTHTIDVESPEFQSLPIDERCKRLREAIAACSEN